MQNDPKSTANQPGSTFQEAAAQVTHPLKKAPLSEAQIRQWIIWFHEKEHRYPHKRDKIVWQKQEDGSFTAVKGESWVGINGALGAGLRTLPGNSSLKKFSEANGLVTDTTLSEDTIRQWIIWFHEKEKRYPNKRDQTVWRKEQDGSFSIVKGETWTGINAALSAGLRGLKGGSSVSQLEEKHNFLNKRRLSDRRLKRWLGWFHEKENRYPTKRDAIVWFKNRKGVFTVLAGENWSAINQALRHGLRGFPPGPGPSLDAFKKANGFVDHPQGRPRGAAPHGRIRAPEPQG